jgi:hypothetical protein
MKKMELTFGLGSRSCTGKNIRFLEIFKVIATLLPQFKVCKRQGFRADLTDPSSSLKQQAV